MTHRERVLATFRFEQPDRLAYDLMEGIVWPELTEYFRAQHGLQEPGDVLEFLDTDFRWTFMCYVRPQPDPPLAPPAQPAPVTFTRPVATGPLAAASTVAEVEAYSWPDPRWWQPADCAEVRRQWPDHALVFSAGWQPLFWSACEAFGVEEALVKMHWEPQVIEAFLQRQHEHYLDCLSRGLAAAQGFCDICWLGDDFSSQQSMILSPKQWRQFIKPRLAEQVALARQHGLLVLYHSCGAVRPVLGDLADIGVNGHLVFQTSATGMEPESIAREFGGRLVFYGGLDVQQLLSYGSLEEVAATVARNARAFADCGGYVVANSHHCVATIKGANVEAMCRAAREWRFP